MKTIIRLVCLAISLPLALGLMTGILSTTAQAATGYDLAALLTNGTIKPLGRTKVSQTGNGITADWSANGFEVIVSGGTTFTVGYDTNITIYTAVHVDGKQINTAGELAGSGIVDVNNVRNANIKCEKGTGSFTVTLTDDGKEHIVSVFRETGHTTKAGDYFRFTTLETDATIVGRPADKDLFIEVIGDSIGTGSGTIGVYQAGVEWKTEDHSAQSSFGWLLSKELNADLSIAARGGIGLLGDASSSQENVGNTDLSMLDIYPNASGHREAEGKYVSPRTPDLVVLELGANDSLKYDNPTKTAKWRTALEEMIALVRTTHGNDVKILLYYQSPIPYAQMLDVADKDPNIYSCHYHFHGNGSIAKETQLSGHPDVSDHKLIFEAILNCIKEQDILGIHGETVAEPTYTDVEYYVSASGDDANDGKSIETAKKSFTAAVSQAVADKESLTDDSRVVIYLDSANGEIPNYTSGNEQILGGNQTVTSNSGNKLPVLVTTYNYGTDGVVKAVLDTSHRARDNGHGSLVMYNDFTFRSITIQGTTRPYTEEATEFYRDRNLYSGYNEVVFDNVTFSHNDNGLTCSNSGGWRVSAGLFGSFEMPGTDSVASITFLNGDYTGLNYVTGVNASTNGPKKATTNPHANHKVIIGEGATMGTVVGLYNTFGPKSVTVEFRGGTVKNYAGTKSGKADAPVTYNTNLTTIFSGGSIQNTKYFGTGNYITFNGNITNKFRKGRFSGRVFAGMGENVTLNGNLTNRISGGEIRVVPAASGDGIFLAGYKNVKITGNVTNKITSGDLNLLFKEVPEGAKKTVDSGIYLGTYSNGKIDGNLTNTISGGNLFAANYVADVTKHGSAGIHLGMSTGEITGTLTNHITAGTFDGKAAGCSKINFGTQGRNRLIGKMVSVIGEPNDPKHGPRFEGTVILGGNMGRVGQDLGNITPNASNNSSEVVISNTIYSGVFGSVYATANHTIGDGYYSYVIGSVETNIQGGRFAGLFYGTGESPVCGHVTTNISGGYFTGIYGAGPEAIVYDGVETNISNFTEFYDAYLTAKSNPCKIYAGGAAAQISAVTAGRDPVKLTLNLPADKSLKTPVYAGFDGNGTASKVKVELKNGILPNIYSSAEGEHFAGSVELVVSGGKVEKLVPVSSGATISGGVTCTISGGTVNSYVGTASGTADAAVTCTTNLTTIVSGGNVKSYMGTGDYVNFNGDIHNKVSGGSISGARFAGLGNNVTLDGDLTNTVSSDSRLYTYPTGSAHGIFFSGLNNCTIKKNVTNNISGGTVAVVFDKDGAEGNIYFGGGENTVIEGNLTNNVSGGTIDTKVNEDGVTPVGNSIYAGSYSGGIIGTLTNNISGGTFTFSNAPAACNLYLSGQSPSTYVGKIVNVLGKETGGGPTINTKKGYLYLAGYYGGVGFDSEPTAAPSEIREDIVIFNTIYGGDYTGTNNVVCGPQGKANNPTYVNGGIQTDIYGGSFVNLRGAGVATVFGKVCTNIHGGTFSSGIYGVYNGVVKDCVELNIFGLDGDCDANVRLAYKATIGSDATLTISHDGTFKKNVTAIYSDSGTITGTIHVALSAGTYTKGINMGVPVKKALAETYSLLNTETGALIDLDNLPDPTTSGSTSVTVGRPIATNLKPQTASVVLNTDLGLNFKLPSTFANGFDAGSVYAVFKMGDTETVVNSYTTTGQTATFKFRNIAPHRMGDTVTATVYATKDGVLYTSETIEYSVKNYCYKKLGEDTSSDALRTLLVDLLNYGALSQQYVDNSIAADQLVNNDLTDEQKAWGTAGDVSVQNITAQAALEGATVTWKATGLYLEKSVDIRLKFYAESTEDLSVKFVTGGKTYTVYDFTPVSGQENCYYVYFTRLNAGQMRQAVEATVYQGSTPVSNTLTYSIESYAAKHQNDATPAYLAELVKAMVRYGVSAANFK